MQFSTDLARELRCGLIGSAFQPEAPQQNARGNDGDRTGAGRGTRWL